MSAPTSLKMNHPLFVDQKIRRRYLFCYLFHIWISFIPVVLFEVLYARLYAITPIWVPLVLIPFNLLIAYYMLIVATILIMKFRIWVLNIFHKPQQGIFPRKYGNKDYRYYSRRNYCRLFPSYLISSTPFPWFKRVLFYQAFNIKIGVDTIHNDVWITPEFVEIGDNVRIGYASAILSSMLEQDKLVIKKVVIEENANIGVKSTILPGVIIKKGAIIDAGSYILPFTVIDKDGHYGGQPAEFKRHTFEIEENELKED